MKKILNISFVCLLAFLATGCTSDDAIDPKVTYYAEIALDGGEYVYAELGQPYQDPGYKAVMQGQDVSDQVKIEGEVNTDEPGLYTLNYVVVNPEGFAAKATRNIFVKDPSDPVAGIYKVGSTSYRDYGGTISKYKGSYIVLVLPGENPGEYEFDDILAGWYNYGAGYGTAYAMPGIVSVDGQTGDVTAEPENAFLLGWGDSFDSFENGKFDATAKTINYAVSYAGAMTFHVNLVQQ